MHAIIYIYKCHLALHDDWPTMGDVLIWHLANVCTIRCILPLLTQKEMIELLLTIQHYLSKLVTTGYKYIQCSVKLMTINTHYTLVRLLNN